MRARPGRHDTCPWTFRLSTVSWASAIADKANRWMFSTPGHFLNPRPLRLLQSGLQVARRGGFRLVGKSSQPRTQRPTASAPPWTSTTRLATGPATWMPRWTVMLRTPGHAPLLGGHADRHRHSLPRRDDDVLGSRAERSIALDPVAPDPIANPRGGYAVVHLVDDPGTDSVGDDAGVRHVVAEGILPLPHDEMVGGSLPDEAGVPKIRGRGLRLRTGLPRRDGVRLAP